MTSAVLPIFHNKADYGIVVERDKDAGVTRVYVDKVKFKHLGTGGVASFIYDPVNGRYLPCQESHDPAVPVEKTYLQHGVRQFLLATRKRFTR